MGQFKLFIITIMYHSLVHTWPRTAKDQCSISDPFSFSKSTATSSFFRFFRACWSFFFFVKKKPRHEKGTQNRHAASHTRTHARRHIFTRTHDTCQTWKKKEIIIITTIKGAITLTLKYRLLFSAPQKKPAHPV